MGRTRTITYELKLGNLVHLLYGLENGRLADEVSIIPILSKPLPQKNPKEYHSCNTLFLDAHFGNIFYELTLPHPVKLANKSQLLADFYGRPQNKPQHKSSWAVYSDLFIEYILSSNYQENIPLSIIDMYNSNKSILEQWDTSLFKEKLQSFVTQIFKAEILEINDPIDSEDLHKLLEIVYTYLETNTIDGFSKALSWLLLGAFLRNKIGKLLKKIEFNSVFKRPDFVSNYIYKDYDGENPSIETYEILKKELVGTEEKAILGDPVAMYETGCMYFHKFNTGKTSDYSKDYESAYKWLMKVVETNQPFSYKASSLLSKMHYRGNVPGEQQSFEKAYDYQLLSDINTSSVVLESILFMRMEGIAKEFNYHEICKIIEDNIDRLNDNSRMNVAEFYIRYGEFQKAIDILKNTAKTIAKAEYTLGKLYLYGVHCTPPKPDSDNAEYHFSKAAEEGMPDAFFEIGLINFRASYGHRQNLVKARSAFQKAADKGHTNAQYHYGWVCRHGLGGERDIPEAIKYFELGAKSGNPFCMAELGILYQESENCNFKKAFEWTQKAVESGDPYSEFVLGNLFYSGRGCRRNLDKAIIHYKNAEKLGIYEASMMLNRIIELKNTK